MKNKSIGLKAFLLILFLFSGYTLKANSQKDNTLRMMSYNIHNAIGLDGVTDCQRIADVINKVAPDVVAIQELDSVTGRSNHTDILQKIAEQTRMHRTFATAIDYDGGKYGIGMLSKEKPLSVRRMALPGREEKRALLIAEFGNYIFACTHFSLTEADRATSLAIIRDVAKTYKKPFFIAGDWNLTPDSPLFTEIQKDFVLLTNPKRFTFPADAPDSCIDYIAVLKSDAPFFSRTSAFVHEEKVASDHRPVVADVLFKTSKEKIFYATPYLQNPTNGGMTVMWQTTVPAHSWVEYGTDTLHLQRARTIVDGQALYGVENKIRLTDLQPGQTYYYRVCSQEITINQSYYKEFGEKAVSSFYSFTLPGARTENFTAVIFNDLHGMDATLKGLYQQVKEVPYDFVVFNGDCVPEPANQQEAMASLAWACGVVDAAHRPAFFIRGNHEIRNAYSIGMRSLFDYVNDKTYSAFNWGDTRLVMLDCGEDKPDSTWVYYGLNDFTNLRLEQADFLKQELKSVSFKKASRRVLLNHIPIYASGDKYAPCTELWAPLLKKAPFDINLCAHTHQHIYHPKGTVGNNFPLVVGGGYKPDGATVMILKKEGKEMTLRVLNMKGEEVLNLSL